MLGHNRFFPAVQAPRNISQPKLNWYLLNFIVVFLPVSEFINKIPVLFKRTCVRLG